MDGLTTTSDGYGRHGDPAALKEQIDRLIAAADNRGDVIRALVERLFPAAQRHIGGSHYGSDWQGRWLRERRVAHQDVLRLYLERVAGEGLQAFSSAEQAWAHMADAGAFDSYLRSLDPECLQDVVSSLETYEEDFRPEHVVPGSAILLNLLQELPERAPGMFSFGKEMVVGRVVYRLVRSLKTPDAVEAAVAETRPPIETISAKLELIDTVGYRENVGHKLVSEAAAGRFEQAWGAQLRAAPPDVLLPARGDLLDDASRQKTSWRRRTGDSDPGLAKRNACSRLFSASGQRYRVRPWGVVQYSVPPVLHGRS